MSSIYKTESSKENILKLYNSQLNKLGCDFKDIYVNTSFGRTHIVETGNFDKEGLLIFHGGNSTTSYNLLLCSFLIKEFHIYAVDIVGHPGKSDEHCISPLGYEYGEWASEVIDNLGIDKIRCFGISYGGGVLAKLMCVSPHKIEKCVLESPLGIYNSISLQFLNMMFSLFKYNITKNKKYIKKIALYMSLNEDSLDSDILETIKNSFDNFKIRKIMPSNVSNKLIKNCIAPTFVIAGEKDCLLRSKKVLKKAEKIIPNCVTYELKNRGHIHLLTEEEKNMIINFLN